MSMRRGSVLGLGNWGARLRGLWRSRNLEVWGFGLRFRLLWFFGVSLASDRWLTPDGAVEFGSFVGWGLWF